VTGFKPLSRLFPEDLSKELISYSIIYWPMLAILVMVNCAIVIALFSILKIRQMKLTREIRNEITSVNRGSSDSCIIYGGVSDFFVVLWCAFFLFIGLSNPLAFDYQNYDYPGNVITILIVSILGFVTPWVMIYYFSNATFVVSNEGIRKISPFSRERFMDWHSVTEVRHSTSSRRGIIQGVQSVDVHGKEEYGKAVTFRLDAGAKSVSSFYVIAIQKVPKDLWNQRTWEYVQKHITWIPYQQSDQPQARR